MAEDGPELGGLRELRLVGLLGSAAGTEAVDATDDDNGLVPLVVGAILGPSGRGVREVHEERSVAVARVGQPERVPPPGVPGERHVGGGHEVAAAELATIVDRDRGRLDAVLGAVPGLEDRLAALSAAQRALTVRPAGREEAVEREREALHLAGVHPRVRVVGGTGASRTKARTRSEKRVA